MHLYARTSDLESFGAQQKLIYPTMISGEIADTAMKIFKTLFKSSYSIRTLGVSVSGFDINSNQMSFNDLDLKYVKREKLEKSVDKIREKYGNKSIQKLVVLRDKRMAGLDIKDDHVIHPESFFKN